MRNEKPQFRIPNSQFRIPATHLPEQRWGAVCYAIFIHMATSRPLHESALRVPLDVLMQSSDAAIVTGSDNTISFWNRSAERMYRISAAEALGMSLDQAYRCVWLNPGDERAAAETLARRGTWEGDVIHVTSDGRQLRIRSNVSAIRDERGSAATLVINRSEQMSRIRGERLMLLSEAAAHLLGAQDPDAMVRELFERVSTHLNVHAYFNFMVNDTGDRLRLDSYAGIPERTARLISTLAFGQAVCGTVAQTRRMIHATHVQESNDPKVELIRRYGIRAYCCNPLIAGDRLLGTLSFGSRAVDCFEDDEVEFMRTICHYVAIAKERLRLEKELRGRIRQLGDADRRKDEFLAMLSHELRNPLAAVSSAIQVLRCGGAQRPFILERSLDAAARQAGHMAHLLDDLLDVSRVTQGKITLKKEQVDLRSAVESAVEAAMPAIRESKHNLSVSICPRKMVVSGDSVRLAQVISNILNNAAKYTSPGGEIRLSIEAEGGEAVIRVADNGAGIEPELLPVIFDLFVQADRSPDRAQGGLGIGLTLARSIVEMHNGRIEAQSDGAGKGSTFVVRLPLAAPEAASFRGEGSDTPQVNARRVLIVDDNMDAAAMMSALLELDGHQVLTAHSGPDAIELAAAHLPDVAVLDIGMPGMDGFELASRLRQNPALAHMVLVALTGYGREEDLERSRAAGFNHHLVKPVDIEALRRVLH